MLDWELCALGDPLADVGFCALLFLPFKTHFSIGTVVIHVHPTYTHTEVGKPFI